MLCNGASACNPTPIQGLSIADRLTKIEPATDAVIDFLHDHPGIDTMHNPVQNPYIRPDKTVAPPNAEPYRDRSLGEPGMIDENDLCYKLFTEHGWSWGGHFSGEKDYQHFSKGSVVD